MTKIAMPYTIVITDWDNPEVMFPRDTGTIEVDPTAPKEALEKLFAMFNRGSGEEIPFLGRSLSVGDVVYLGETAWRCESFGWRPYVEKERTW